eukprot:333376-Alexandrium_andersonii.AAC.1
MKLCIRVHVHVRELRMLECLHALMCTCLSPDSPQVLLEPEIDNMRGQMWPLLGTCPAFGQSCAT